MRKSVALTWACKDGPGLQSHPPHVGWPTRHWVPSRGTWSRDHWALLGPSHTEPSARWRGFCGENIAKNCAWRVGLGQSDLVMAPVITWGVGGLASPGEVGGGGMPERTLEGRLPALSMDSCWRPWVQTTGGPTGQKSQACLRAWGCRCELSCWGLGPAEERP